MKYFLYISSLCLFALVMGCDTQQDSSDTPVADPRDSGQGQTISGDEIVASEASDILATRGDIALTFDEFHAAIERIPKDQRGRFLSNPNTVNQTIDSLLLNRMVADKARAAGFDERPLTKLRVSLAAEEILAKAWLENIAAESPDANYIQIAEEQYQANPEEFKSNKSVDLTHLLVSVNEDRTEEQAKALAEELTQQVLGDPDNFKSLVMEYSDDPSKEQNQGSLTGVEKDDVVAGFGDAAFQLDETGEIAAPVKSKFGYHIIRLDGINPPQQLSFEDVRSRLILAARDRHQLRTRNEYLSNLAAVRGKVEPGAIDRLLKYYDFQENTDSAANTQTP